MKRYKQGTTCIKHKRFTKDELISIFEEEAQLISKKPDEARSIAESTLNDFIKRHGKYVGLI